MKKLLFGLIVTVLFSMPLFSQDINRLSKDANFLSLVRNEDEFIKKATDKELLKVIYADKKLNDDELSTFYKVFSTNEKDFYEYIKTQNELYNILNTKYNFEKYSKIELQTIFSVQIEEIYMSTSTSRSNCYRRYLNAIAINASAAALGHTACLSVDWTGIGAAVCHGSVFVAHIAANDNAYLDYKDCLNGE